MQITDEKGDVYQNEDWVVLIRTPYGGYDIGEVYQIEQVTCKTGTFSAKKKGSQEIQTGFSICCHRRALFSEIPIWNRDIRTINDYPIY